MIRADLFELARETGLDNLRPVPVKVNADIVAHCYLPVLGTKTLTGCCQRGSSCSIRSRLF